MAIYLTNIFLNNTHHLKMFIYDIFIEMSIPNRVGVAAGLTSLILLVPKFRIKPCNFQFHGFFLFPFLFK